VISGEYFLDTALEVPETVEKLVLAEGTKLKVRGDHYGLSRRGSIQLVEFAQEPMKRGDDFFVSGMPEHYEVGDAVMLSGANVISDSPDRYGYLRVVVGVYGDVVTVDRPLPRKIDREPRVSGLSLAPPLWIDGLGEIFSVAPKFSTRALINFFASRAPRVTSIEVHSNGGTGIGVGHCLGGDFDCRIHDLLDDGKNHFGYGVAVTGSSRDIRVAGTISRVRHAVTTSTGGLIDGVGYAGEPEDCLFEPVAIDCSNKAIDTHRVGWGITIIPHVIRGNGGVQVRADNVTVRGGTIADTGVSGVNVQSVVKVAAIISGVAISGMGRGIGIVGAGPVHIKNCVVAGEKVAVEIGSDSSIDGLNVVDAGSVAVRITGDDNSVKNVRFASGIDTRVEIAEGAKGNDVSVSSP
jgi:hypothetical protein